MQNVAVNEAVHVCLLDRIVIGHRRGHVLAALCLGVETDHVIVFVRNLTSDHVSRDAAGQQTYDVASGNDRHPRTESGPRGEW